MKVFRLLALLVSVLVWLLFSIPLMATAFGQEPAQQRPRRVTVDSGTVQKPGTTGSAKDEIDEDDVVRVDTQLVSVPAVVTNSAGRPLAGLRTENFLLFENGRQQKITEFATTETPFEIALLLDTSGSTRADVALIRQAANAFVDALRPGDRVAIVGFNTLQQGRSAVAAPEVLSKLTGDRKELRLAIERLGSSNGTPFYDGLQRIADEIFIEAPAEEMKGRRAMVALTDGVDSASDSDFQTVRVKLTRGGIASYFIQVNTEEFVEDRLLRDCGDDGAVVLSRKQMERYRRLFFPKARREDYVDFCSMGSFERMQISRDLYNLARREMNELAKASGGNNYLAATLQDARAAFAKVAAEIGTQYSLGYYPENKTRDGKFRTIRVEVQGVADKAQVRAREGYYAPKG
jgi:Ca-activated chloride channel family protein